MRRCSLVSPSNIKKVDVKQPSPLHPFIFVCRPKRRQHRNILNGSAAHCAVLHYGCCDPLSLCLTPVLRRSLLRLPALFFSLVESLVGPWVCSKPRQDDPLSGLAGEEALYRGATDLGEPPLCRAQMSADES